MSAPSKRKNNPQISNPSSSSDLPDYEKYTQMQESRTPYAARFAEQILRTTEPFVKKPPDALHVLDVGCGYGATAIALSQTCARVVGIDPEPILIASAVQTQKKLAESAKNNIDFRVGGLPEWECDETFDLIVLDNVYEHLPEQRATLRRVADLLNPGGACFLLVPNRLWPIEVHYRLPFLSYLPLPVANLYLRVSGRGRDYQDCSYTPTYGSLARDCRSVPALRHRFVLPADVKLATGGNSWFYRLGVKALRFCPTLWWVSKALLVVLWKEDNA